MDIIKLFLKTIFFVIISFISDAQIVLTGEILDKSDKQPLIGATVRVVGTNVSTIANEEGMFSIQVDKLPVDLTFSYVGYQSNSKKILSTDVGKVVMQYEPIMLSEVTTGNPAIALLNNVVRKALSDTTNKYYKAFYQRVSTDNGQFSRIQEMFLNVSWNVFGVSGWQPITIRSAENNPRQNSNQYFLSFLYSGIVFRHTNSPINSIEIGNNFTLKVKQYINAETDREIAVINFFSIDKKSPKNTGEIYISTKNNNLLKVTRHINYDSKKFKREISINAIFDESENGENYCKNIYINEKSGRKGTFKKSDEKIWLYFVNSMKGFDRNGKIYAPFFKSDKKILDETPYNADYWAKNIPFTQTKLVDRAVKNLEKEGKFKGNFN